MDGIGAGWSVWAGGLIALFIRMASKASLAWTGLDGWVVYIGVEKSLIENAATLDSGYLLTSLFDIS
jgi:hypothetical protein